VEERAAYLFSRVFSRVFSRGKLGSAR